MDDDGRGREGGSSEEEGRRGSEVFMFSGKVSKEDGFSSTSPLDLGVGLLW